MAIQDEARALGEPTRYRLFRALAEAEGPMAVAELTDLVDQGHNAVRRHLAVLVEAGLAEELVEDRHRRGRPRLLYRLAPAAAGRWETDGPYRDLSIALLEVLRSGEDPAEVGARIGAAAPAAASVPGGGVDAVVQEMARRGFAPSVVVTSDDEVEVVLDSCPFADAAAVLPAVVCALHEGLARGVVGEGSGLAVEALVPGDPAEAGCRLLLRRRPG